MNSSMGRMDADPVKIAASLREIAGYLWLEGESFRARAYQRAAAIVESAPELERLIREARLTSLPRIGPALAGTITALAGTGTASVLEKLRVRWPSALIELQSLPGLGAEKARVLHERLGINSIDELAEACTLGRVRDLPGFGARSEQNLAEAIATRGDRPPPALLLPQAREMATSLQRHLAACHAAVRTSVAGEVRRWLETAHRLDLAVATHDPAAVRAHLERHPMVLAVAEEDEERARVTLVTGTAAALHTAPPERWGVTLARATGAEAHWQKLVARAAARGIDLDRFAAADEREVYAAVGLPYLPPEVRDGDDELDAADVGSLDDRLVEPGDVRGAVHCHTVHSDGKATIEEMALAAVELGFEYLTITDHSASAHYAGGLTLERLRQQWNEIDEVQQRVGIRLFKGTEADILADGALDWPDTVLEQLDVVIASVHQRHKLDEDEMTRRLVRAMRLPVFKIWGHALGRLIGRREPFKCHVEEVLDAIAAAPAAIEINGDPHRLDLEPRWARRASERGIRFVLASDAHSTGALSCVEYAVAMARRARLRPEEVLNTLSADAFARAVKPKRGLRAA